MLKKIFIPKYLLIALIALIFLISGSDNNNNITHAQSGSLLSLFGFAWSENFGWISFNNSDCNNEEYELCQNISSPYDNLPYSCYPELNYFMDCGRVTPTNIPPCTRTSQVNPTTKYCVLCPPGYTKTAAWQVGGGTFWEEPNACCSNSRTGGIANCAITCATSECTANGGKCIDWCYKCNHDAVNYICDNTSGMPDCPINNPNGYDCTSATWRVQIDETTGDMSGYAWSPYLDYISFERSTAGDPPQAPYNTGSGPIAKYGLAGNPYGIPEKYLDGWARALLLNDASGNQNGWRIKCKQVGNG